MTQLPEHPGRGHQAWFTYEEAIAAFAAGNIDVALGLATRVCAMTDGLWQAPCPTIYCLACLVACDVLLAQGSLALAEETALTAIIRSGWYQSVSDELRMRVDLRFYAAKFARGEHAWGARGFRTLRRKAARELETTQFADEMTAYLRTALSRA